MTATQPTDRGGAFVHANGIDIHYTGHGSRRTAGAAPRRPDLHRPDLGRRPRRLQRPHRPALAEHFRVIAPDTRGSRRTVHNDGTPSATLLADDVAAPHRRARTRPADDLRIQRGRARPPRSSASATPDRCAPSSTTPDSTCSTPTRRCSPRRRCCSAAARSHPGRPRRRRRELRADGHGRAVREAEGRPRRRPGRGLLAHLPRADASSGGPGHPATPSTTSASSPPRRWCSPATATCSARVEDAVTTYRTLPAAELAVLPNHDHTHRHAPRSTPPSSSSAATPTVDLTGPRSLAVSSWRARSGGTRGWPGSKPRWRWVIASGRAASTSPSSPTRTPVARGWLDVSACSGGERACSEMRRRGRRRASRGRSSA